MERDQKRAAAQVIKQLCGAGKHAEAWAQLVAISEPGDDLPLQARYAQLAKALPDVTAAAQPLKVAVVGSSTLDHFASALTFWLLREGFAAELFVSPFDTVRQTVLDPGSGLYAFEPDVVWLFTSHRDVRLAVDAGAAPDAVDAAVNGAVADTCALWGAVRAHSPAFVFQNNADLPVERTFGNYEGSVPWSQTGLLRAYNVALSRALRPGVTVFDLDALSSVYGKGRWHDARFWHHSKHAFAPDATGLVAFRGARLLASLRGRAKKVLVLDLDNTLWGGVVGDDGVDGIQLGEGFVAFQRYVKTLKDRGVVLAVASKNELRAAEEPFRRHDQMVLKLDDFAVFRASWNNKADALREIAGTLNLGLDALVFVDDNPAERALVRQLLPMVAVPELPVDPSDYVRALDEGAWFETVAFSDEDKQRAQQYRENAIRDDAKASFASLDQFLQSLQMVAEVGGPDAAHLPRMSQLVNKSNQFHLTGTRYSESQLQALAQDPSRRVMYFTLKDRFGDNGLISVVVLERRGDSAHVDTWVMSCRVLSRGMEEFICAEIIAAAERWGCTRVEGAYIATAKNQLVAGLYPRLGFSPQAGGVWSLALGAGRPAFQPHIARAEGA